MKNFQFFTTVVAAVMTGLQACAQQQEPRAIEPKPIGKIERLDSELDHLISPDAKIETLAEGFRWSEGPVWLPEQKYLVFSDVPRNTAYSWSEMDGLSVYLKPSGYSGNDDQSGNSGSNGLALDKQGRLLLCQHGDRRLARMDAPLEKPESKFVTLADKYEGKRFHSPNDLVVHSSGAVFFTDPPYGLPGGLNSPQRELDFQGVYRLDPDGKVHSLVRDLRFPNGIALSPDEKTLYVAQSDRSNLIYMAYDLNEKLEPSNGRILFDANQLARDRAGSCDGMKVDRQGNVFATGPGGVLVITPQGKHLGTIMPGTLVANCGFGDDGSTLYLTAERYLCRVRLTTRGLGFGEPSSRAQ